MKYIYVLFFFLILFVGVNASAKAVDVPTREEINKTSTSACAVCNRISDSLALLSLYQFTNGPEWVIPWNLEEPMNNWHGVVISTEGCVGVLNLVNNGLVGLVPDLNLPELIFLDLSSNGLVGGIPNFSHLEIVQTINLNNNNFTGFIPEFNLLTLNNLDLSDNLLIGNVPSFHNIPSLERLNLGGNMLSGNLPLLNGNSQLESLVLSNNNFGGNLPNYSFLNLKLLDVSQNNIFGTIPDLDNIPNLEVLNLSNNNFLGNIPNFPSFTKLTTLLANDNNLFGPIPDFQYMPALKERLWLQNNRFTGTAPNFSNIFQLEDLNLNNNLLDSVPRFTFLPNLRTLRVANNSLTFDDLLHNVGLPSFAYEYAPQTNIFPDVVVSIDLGDDYVISLPFDRGLTNNNHIWIHDDVIVQESTVPNFSIINATLADKGTYYAVVSNFALPALEIVSGRTTIRINGTSFNDLCEFATDLTDSSEICNEFFFFDVEPDATGSTCGFTPDNIWFSFVAQGPSVLVFLSNPTDPGMRIALYDFGNAPCQDADGVELACGSQIEYSALVTGREYYLAIYSNGDFSQTFSLCLVNSASQTPPLNDIACNAAPIVPTRCQGGNTVFATQDLIGPGCDAYSTNSVWFKTRLSSGMDKLRIDLTINTIFNDISLMVGTFENGCSGPFTPVDGGVFCERPRIFEISDLEAEKDYYIKLGTSDLGAGSFLMCLEELGRLVVCGINDDCNDSSDNGPIDIPVFTNGGVSCYAGCNTGAEPGYNQNDNSCYSFYNPTVWYTFTTDDKADFLSIDINSGALVRPYFALYETDDCLNYTNVVCKLEGNGIVTLNSHPIKANTTYHLAISDFYGLEGDFLFCLSTYENTSICNVDNSLEATATSMGSPLEGPYQSGEEVTFCYKINTWQFISCNWLQGIVPSFGPCWDPSSFDDDGEPLIINKFLVPNTVGTWKWIPSNVAQYNAFNPSQGYNIGQFLGAGWYFINELTDPVPDMNDPNTSLGDGFRCALDNPNWEICFTLKATAEPDCSNISNCNISVKTFTDGEVGIRSRAACLSDVATYYNSSLQCCNNPDADSIPNYIVCSGGTLTVPLFSSDTAATFNVLVNIHPDIVGAIPGNFVDTLTQVLINNSTEIVTLDYTAIPESRGCLGDPLNFTVSVYPTPVINAQFDETICKGDSIELTYILEGEGPFTIEYNANGEPQAEIISDTTRITLKVSPDSSTTYSVTKVTGSQGCFANVSEDIFLEVRPTTEIMLTPVICEGESYIYEDDTLRVTGVYPYVYPNANNFLCDSTIIIDLTVGLNYRDTLVERICEGSFFTVGNNNYDKTGTYVAVLQSILGCDSIVVLNLTVNDSIRVKDQLIINDNGTSNGIISINVEGGRPPYSYLWNNDETTPLIQNLPFGNYTLTVTDIDSCQSVFTFEVKDLTNSVQNILSGIKAEISPVPSKTGETIFLTVDSDISSNLQIDIGTTAGTPVYHAKWRVSPGNQRLSLPGLSAPGMYWLKLMKEDSNFVFLKILVY